LHWTLERLAMHGVSDVMINLHHLGGSVKDAVGDGSAFGLRVSYSRERSILGTGGGPRKVRDFFGSAPCLLVNGDVYFDLDLGELLAAHRASGARVTLALLPKPRGSSYGGVVTGKDGEIRSLGGLPHPARGTTSLFTGVHVLDPALLELLPRGASDSVRDLYAPMVARGERLKGLRMRGRWYDFGSPSLYLASQLTMLSSKSLVHPAARIEPGARVVKSVVGAGAVVRAGALVRESVLWAGTEVGVGARLRRVILAEGKAHEREQMTGMVVLKGERHQVAL
jgi:NDP-sugar pyrophosphorylase family protein